MRPAIDEAEVEASLHHARLDCLGVGDDEPWNDARMASGKYAEEARQQENRDRRAGADHQRADFLAAQFLDPRVELGGQREDAVDILERDRPRARQRDTTADTVEQTRIE